MLSTDKVKVKVTLVQALRLCTGRMVHRGSRGIALLRLCTGRTAHRESRGIALLRLCTGRTAHRGSRGIALLRLCTGRTAHRGSRGIALLIYDQRHEKGVTGQRHALTALYPPERPGTHCTGGWVGLRAGLDWCGKSRPHRNSIPGPSIP
jgi:hypothetical protein